MIAWRRDMQYIDFYMEGGRDMTFMFGSFLYGIGLIAGSWILGSWY